MPTYYLTWEEITSNLNAFRLPMCYRGKPINNQSYYRSLMLIYQAIAPCKINKPLMDVKTDWRQLVRVYGVYLSILPTWCAYAPVRAIIAQEAACTIGLLFFNGVEMHERSFSWKENNLALPPDSNVDVLFLLAYTKITSEKNDKLNAKRRKNTP